MSIQTRVVDYVDADTTFQGLMAWDDSVGRARPGVMIAHTIAGRSPLEEKKARRLAELGYVGFALDVYGKGTQTTDIDTNREMMSRLLGDRSQLQQRLLAGLQAMRALAEVDADKVAAIGFCFGGLCVLDVARTGADIAGVVSFHGLLTPPDNTAGNRMNAKVLALHGWDDPLARPDEAVALAQELTAMGADWQLHGYGNTMHAFTNPGAQEPDQGKMYNADADRRSWIAMQNFLAELFGVQEV